MAEASGARLKAAQARLNRSLARKRLRQLGKPLVLHDAAVDALTSADVLATSEDAAVALWDQAAKGTGLVGLLDATTEDVP